MAFYNIPGITTSVIDYSNVQKQLLGGRSVLIAGFSKFGSEEIMNVADADELKYKTGGANYTKYGPAINYVISALSVTSNVYFKRLIPSDATYANIGIDASNNAISISGATDKKTIISSGNNLSIYAKSRGEGYGEFFLTFSEAEDLDRAYADGEGNPKYKYNFLRATLYQNSPNGIKTILNPTAVSLIDVDPVENVPVLDLTTGESLFIEDRIDTKNDFVEIAFNQDILPEIKKYLSVEEINKEKGTPELILKDIVTGISYRVLADADNNLFIQATQLEGQDKIVLRYFLNGANNYKKMYVEKGQLKVDVDLTVNEGYDTVYTSGKYNFVEISVNPETQNIEVKEFNTLRADIYKKLINKTWVLENGSDGENLVINGQLNFNGPGEIGKENAKMLIIQYFTEDSQIREAMYPEIDFDYVVDWTTDLNVINSIINLLDDIGISQGIISLPLAYSPEEDLKVRSESLYQSTYNCALYSGQWNLKHYEEYSGKNIAMPLSYYMMIQHLKIDNTLSITEPVAGIVKGTLPVSNIKLSYTPRSVDIEKLRNQQINTIIKETDGIYAIDQLNMYKKASKLSRINLVKVIHRIRKDLPKLLKPFIQVKETGNNISDVLSTVGNYMDKYKVSIGGTNPDEIFNSISITPMFIPEEYKLVVSIRVNPIGTIENIDIPIIVE